MDEFQTFHNQERQQPTTTYHTSISGSTTTTTADDLFGQTLNVSSHEIASLIRHLQTVSPQKRFETLKSLRTLVKRSRNVLPLVCQSLCFSAIEDILREDRRPSVLCECLWLCVDVIPSIGHNLDICLTNIVPQVVRYLGNESADVRRASLRLLHVYMRYTNNLQKCLRAVIQYGVESRDAATQQGVVMSLPLLFTDEFANENLYLLVESLAQLLISAENNLFYPVFLALQRIHSIVGNETFGRYLDGINAEAQQLYRSVLSRNPSADSAKDTTYGGGTGAGSGSGGTFLAEPTLLETKRKAVSIREDRNTINTSTATTRPLPLNTTQQSREQTTGRDVIPLDQIIAISGNNQIQRQFSEETNGSHESNDETMCGTYNPHVRFGLFPHALIYESMYGKMESKLESIQSVLHVIRDVEMRKLAQILPFMQIFLVEYISGQLLEQNNFKVTLSALDIIEILVERLKSSMTPFMPTIVAILAKRLGDGRTVIRDSVIKVLHQLMYTFAPQDMIDQLLQQKPSKNPKIREEIINRVTAAVLTFPRSEFNLARLCFSIAPMLTDNRRMVRLASLECLAVLAQALGPHKLAPLMSAVDAIESSCELEGLVAALQARLARRALPRCAADGTIRYILNPQHFTGWFTSSTDADLEWVMLATPTSTGGTPPKTMPLTRKQSIGGQLISGIPLGTIPFDRRRSTVVTIPPSTMPTMGGAGVGGTDSNGGGADAMGVSMLGPHDVDDDDNDVELSRRKSIAEINIEHLLHSGEEAVPPPPHQLARSPVVGHKQLDPPPQPLERPFLDSFVGESFNSDDMLDNRRDSEENRASSLEVWRQYFSRFRKQLADAALCGTDSDITLINDNSFEATNGFSFQSNPNPTQHVIRRKSDFQLPLQSFAIGAQDITGDEFQRGQSPQQSSSAPSTASADVQYFPSVQMSGSEDQLLLTPFEPQLERSMSLPSIGPQIEEPEVEEQEDYEPEVERDRSRSRSRRSGTEDGNGREDGEEVEVEERDQKQETEVIVDLEKEFNEKMRNQFKSEFMSREDEKANHVSDKPSANPSSEHEMTSVPLQNGNTNSNHEIRRQNVSNESRLEIRPMDENMEPTSEPPPPALSVQEATPLHQRRRSSSVAELHQQLPDDNENQLKDISTQKDETLSSETNSNPDIDANRQHVTTNTDNNNNNNNNKEKSNNNNTKRSQSRVPQIRRKRAQPLGRQSRSQSPQNRRRLSRQPQQIYIKTTPAIPVNANIRHILVNVAKTEGPFDNPLEAVRAAIMALQDDAWTTKVEGMLAVTRLATFHPHSLLKDQHQIVSALVFEVKNLRSTVSRSAIFSLGELFSKLRTQVEPEMDSMVASLLQKSGENVVFIREDIDRALTNCIEEMPQTRAALALIHNGSNHRNTFVRKTCAQFLSILVDKMGAIKCLLGPRDIGEHLLPAAARFVQDGSPHTRYFGRKIFSVLMHHNAFEKLLRKHVTPGTYRNICGILESIKRRGIGDRPTDLLSPMKSTPSLISDVYETK